MVTINSWNSEDPAQVAKGGTGLATITDHNLMVGSGTAAVTPVAPSATVGVPVVSAGAAVDPAFGTAVVAGGGTGLTSTTAYAVICGGTTSTAALQSIAGVGTSGQVLTSNGAAALPTFQAAGGGGSGSIVQKVVTVETSGTTCNTVLPIDTSIPQNTEGDEVMTVTITPTDGSNIIELYFHSLITQGGAAHGSSGAFFVDATADAIHAETLVSQGSSIGKYSSSMYFREVASSTSARTYKLRVGPHVGSVSTYVNSNVGAAIFGGINHRYLSATEVKP